MSSDKSTPRSTGANSSRPKWVCYIKGSASQSSLILTFLPSTFRDLKRMLLDDSSLNLTKKEQEPESPVKSSSGINIVHKPIVRLRNNPFFTTEDTETANASINSSMSNLEQMQVSEESSGTPTSALSSSLRNRSQSGSSGEFRGRLSSAVARAKRAALKTRYREDPHAGLPPIGSTTSSAMRNRTLSVDSYGLSDRNRCLSMDSKSQLRGGIKSALSTRLRTQTHSQIQQQQRGKPLPNIGKAANQATNTIKPRKVWGSVTLPIYVFDCNNAALVNPN